MRGWVYVMSNPSMPGIVKVGFSMKDPLDRADELAHTGIPSPYLVHYDVLIEDPESVEQAAHIGLSNVRVNQRREWFQCSAREAVQAIRQIIGSRARLENFIRDDARPTETLKEFRDLAKGSPIAWTLKTSTGELTHLASGQRFSRRQYYFDNAGLSRGFAITDSRLPWADLASVKEMD
jgi:predicted RNase H-like HicB family nuclease